MESQKNNNEQHTKVTRSNECLTYGMYSMVSTLLIMTTQHQHVSAKDSIQGSSIAVSGPLVPDRPEAGTQASAVFPSPSKSRRARAKRTRQRLWSSAHAVSLQAPCTIAEYQENSCQTSIEGEEILHIEGEDFLLMSRVEELTRMTAARTADMGQQKFDSRHEGMLAKFEAERLRLNGTIMDLEKELCTERAKAPMLAADSVQEEASDLAHAAHDWDAWDPWLFFDKDELAPMSQTCPHWQHLVEENTPFFSLTPCRPEAEG